MHKILTSHKTKLFNHALEYTYTHICGQKMADWDYNLSISLTFELLFVGISISGQILEGYRG